MQYDPQTKLLRLHLNLAKGEVGETVELDLRETRSTWKFPTVPFVEYGEADVWWARQAYFGHEEVIPGDGFYFPRVRRLPDERGLFGKPGKAVYQVLQTAPMERFATTMTINGPVLVPTPARR